MGARGKVFLARQPILDARTRIVGHEVLYRHAAEAAAAVIGDASQASARVMLDAFNSFDVDSILGTGLGFFNVNAEVLDSDMVESLPPRRVVLEILESVVVTPALADRCRQLRRRGFTLALDDYVHDDPRHSLLDLVGYVKIDLPAVPPRELTRLVSRLKSRPVRLLAEKVETREEFARCRKLGFELFQGYYFARPTTMAGRSIDPARSTVMELLRMLSRGAGLAELSAEFKRNADLGLTLLRIVNSVEFARRQRIKNVEQALVLLGERRLRRWLALLLFAGDRMLRMSAPLLQTAVMRGRLLEVLAGHCRALAGPDGESRAFLAGMLSLADVLLCVSLRELVDSLCLDSEIRGALLHREGQLGELLALAEAVERADFPDLELRLEGLGLLPDALASAELSAFRWASGLAGAAAGAR